MPVDRDEIISQISSTAEELGVPSKYALAVAEQESDFNQDAVGTSGERGVFQIMEGTARDLGVDPEDLSQNIKGGVTYLKQLNERYDGDWDKTLSAYNGGMGNVDRGTVSDAASKYPELVKARTGKYASDEQRQPEQQTEQRQPDQPDLNVAPNAQGFSSVLLRHTNTPEFDALSFEDKSAELSKIYHSKKEWQQSAYPIFKEVMDTYWNSADPDELPDIEDVIGAPPITPAGGDPVKETAAWKTQVIQDLLKQGVSPAIFGNRLDAYLSKSSKDEIDGYGIRNESAWSTAGNFTRDIAKGAISAVTQPLAGIQRLAGGYEAADETQKIPELLGKPNDGYLYETDERGNIKLDENNQPIERWVSAIGQGVGNVGSMLAGGFVLRGLGLTTSAISKGFFTTNTLSSANSIFKDVYDKTGNVGQAYEASLFALPAAAVQTLGEAAVISKFANPVIKGLSPYNQTKFLGRMYARLHAAAGNAVVEGAAEGAGNLTEQIGQSTQTGADIDWNQVRINAAVGGIVGGGVGAITGPRIEPTDSSKPQLPPVIPAPVVRGSVQQQIQMASSLEEFQKSPAQELVLTPEEASRVHPDLMNVLHMEASSEGDNVIVRKKTSYTPPTPGEDIATLTTQIYELSNDLISSGVPSDSFTATKNVSDSQKELENNVALEAMSDPEGAAELAAEGAASIEKAQARTDKLNSKTFPNDVSLKQATLNNLFEKRKVLIEQLKAEQQAAKDKALAKPKGEGEAKAAPIPEVQSTEEILSENAPKVDFNVSIKIGGREVVPFNGKYYGVDAEGSLEGEGYDYYVDAVKGRNVGQTTNPDIELDEPTIPQYKSTDFTSSSESLSDIRAEFESVKDKYPGTEITLKNGNKAKLLSAKTPNGTEINITAYDEDGNKLGELSTSTVTEDFEGTRINPGAYVVDSAKRQGVATAMYDLAISQGALIPSLDQRGQVRTEEGQAFREAYDRRRYTRNDSAGAMKATGLRPEKITERFAQSDAIDPLISQALGGKDSPGVLYPPQSHTQSEALSQQYIAQHGGIAGATQAFLNLPEDIASADLIFTGKNLAKHYSNLTAEARKNGDMKAADAAAQLAASIYIQTSKIANNAGQTVEAAKILAEIDPDVYMLNLKANLKDNGLPGLTEEQEARLKELSDLAQKQGGILQQDTLFERSRLETEYTKGALFKDEDALYRYFISSLLSDPSTKAVNIIGNAFNLAGSIISHSIGGGAQGRADGAVLLKGLIQGATREGIDAAFLERMGVRTYRPVAPKEGKFYHDRPGDYQPDPVKDAPWWMKKTGLNYLGYVLRSLSGDDAFFYKTAKEGMARMAAYDIAVREGLRGEALKNRMSELLYDDAKAYEDALSQAQKELELSQSAGLLKDTGGKLNKRKLKSLVKARAAEIIDLKRDPRVRAEAINFAHKATYTNKAEGVLGSLARKMNEFGRLPLTIKIRGKEVTVRPFRYAMPFINTAANILNASTDYIAPISVPRAYLFKNDFSSLEKRNMLGKAIIGTVLGSVLYALAEDYQDEKDPYFALYTEGPKDSNQNAIWRQSGGQKYSMKIGDTYIKFSETPVGPLLAILAASLNEKRYNKNWDTKSNYALLKAGLGSAIHSFTSNSFLKTLGDTVKAATGSRDEYGRTVDPTDIAINIGKGFSPGVGFQRFISKLVDDPIATADDLQAKLISGTPWVQRIGNKPALNVFGKPIERTFEDRLSFIGRFYSERATDPNFRWLAKTGYEVPGFEITGAQARFAGKTIDNLRYEMTEQAGPLIEKKVAQYRERYGLNEFSEDVQDRLRKDVIAIRKKVRAKILGADDKED